MSDPLGDKEGIRRMGAVEKTQPVFVSFATEDEDVVRDRIYGPLKDAGFEVFMYTEARDGGVIAAKIRHALERAGSLVFALSEHSADPDREWLPIELDGFLFTHKLEAVTAVNVGKVPPLPLLQQGPVQLRGLDVLDIEGWFERARPRLEQVLDRKAAPVARPPSLPEWATATWPLVDGIADRLPSEFFEYPAPIVAELQAKIKKAGVVILRGSQLSGKSKLLRQLADRFPERVEVKSIRPQDIEAGLRELFDADRQTAAPESGFLLPLAVWASYAARYVLDQLKPAERARVETSPGGPHLARYADSRRVALDDIQIELRRWGDGKGGPNQILAFQRSLANSLAPVWDYADRIKPVLLPILIEDFHEYAGLSGASGPSACATNFEAFAERFLDRIDYLATAQMQSNREPQPVYIIVTTRAVESPGYRPTTAYADLEELTGGIQPEDMASALNSGSGPWSKDDVRALVPAAMQAVSGHAYLLDRFLRAATALRTANPDRSVDEIVDAVQALPQIWYQDRLFETGVRLESPPKIHSAKYTPFLTSVARLAMEETQFLAEYRKILERDGGRRGDTTYDKVYVVPLLQLGLIKADPEGGGYVPSSPIVKRFFSPTSLVALLGLGR